MLGKRRLRTARAVRLLVALTCASCTVRGEGLSIYECRDGFDNDRDGLIDCEDAPCGAYVVCATIVRPGAHAPGTTPTASDSGEPPDTDPPRDTSPPTDTTDTSVPVRDTTDSGGTGP